LASRSPKTVAIVAADAEFAQNAADGARQSIKEIGGFETVMDQKYPPSTTDYTPVMRAVHALNPDIVYVAAYPTDSVGIVRAANEIGLTPKMFGGTFIGLLLTPIKTQLGPLMNGIVNNEVYLPTPSLTFPGTLELLAKYRAIAQSQGIDPIGWAYPPLAYAAGQVLGQAVEGTKSVDQVKIAAYIHSQMRFRWASERAKLQARTPPQQTGHKHRLRGHWPCAPRGELQRQELLHRHVAQGCPSQHQSTQASPRARTRSSGRTV
jgi:ABC-type branched-subunit amino acid transport system substrate-binding protein